MEVASEKRSPDRQIKAIVTTFVVVFLLIAVILCVGGVGALYIQKLQARIESLEKVCDSEEHHEADKREVLSSSTPNIQTLIQLQTTLQNQYQVGDADLQHQISAQATELRQELQQQLGDVRQLLSTELGTMDKRIETLTREMDQFHPSTRDVTCATGYKLNPYRGTCVRFVRTPLSWSDAKSTCEKSGEFLITIDTVESAYWVRHQQLTAGWNRDAWIGAMKLADNPEFRWYGINTGVMSYGYWAHGQPDHPKSELCVVTTKSRHYYWNDLTCNSKAYFLCEQKAD